jgi:xanthine dehydrogenase YagS FAD-binding subunit
VKAFKHINATSVEETIELIRAGNGRACLIAGGTDLLGILKDEVLPDYPETVINIKTIAGLDRFENNSDGLKIGALAKLVDVVAHPLVRKKIPILSQAAEAVATPEIRNMLSCDYGCKEVFCGLPFGYRDSAYRSGCRTRDRRLPGGSPCIDQ